MLANRVRMGVYSDSEELPIYLLESGTDSYLNWNITSSWALDPDTSYGNSDFIHLFGVPVFDWNGDASISPAIDIGNRNWLEVTFSHDRQDPPFSEQVTALFDISERASKTITYMRFNSSGWFRMDIDDTGGAFSEYLTISGVESEELSLRLYSICLK